MVAGIVIYLCAFFVIPTPDGYDNYMICPTYETKEVEKEYKWAVDLFSEYKLSLGSNYFNEDGLLVTNEEYSYVLTSNGVTGEIEFKNILNDNKISLAEKYKNYLLIENKDDFIIIIETSYTTVLYGRYPKILANNEEDFLKLVKNGLKEYHVPDIYLITTLQFPKDEYTYASIKLDLGDRMFFDKDDKLYVIE